MRARIAAGFCERIAEWNGFGRIILPSAAGVDAVEGSTPDPSTSAALMAQVPPTALQPVANSECDVASPNIHKGRALPFAKAPHSHVLL